jgi:5'(3')-deoxyribonucleotidase
MKVIGVDVDDVVAKLMEAWLLEYNRRSGDRLTPADLTTWEIGDFVKPEWKERIFTLLTPAMYDVVEAWPGTQQAVRKIRNHGNEVWFITSAHTEELFLAKKHWLDRNGFEYDRAIGVGGWSAYKTKQEIPGVDWLVDDHIGNLRGLDGYPILQTRPHNWRQIWEGKRIKHLDDIVPLLTYEAPRELLKPAGFIAGPLKANAFSAPQADGDSYSVFDPKLVEADTTPAIIAAIQGATVKQSNPKDSIGSDKIPLHLWPETATVLGSLGMLDGALKYGRSNFRAIGVRYSIYLDAIRRHGNALLEGEDNDPDSEIHHLGHILASAAILVDAMAADKLVDDRNYKGGYRSWIDKMTVHVKRLKDKHKDRSPKHYTIQDNAA